MSNQIPDLSEFKDSILSESTLLYLEDNKEERKEARDIFKGIFKKVLIASDGQEGLDLFHQNRDEINLILTDINMPNMDGIAFMENVRQCDWSIPILITTEIDNLSVIPKVIKLKVSNFVFKPILFKTTIKIMHEILEQISHLQLLERRQQELKQFKDILDAQSLVSETDLTGKIIYANEAFCEVSGYTQEELLGKPHNIVRHPDISPRIYENMWDTIQAGNVWAGKLKNKAKDGTSYHVKATVFPIFDTHGDIVKYMSSRYLITNEEQEKQKLKKFIMSQRSDMIKNTQKQKISIQKKIDDALAKSKLNEFQKIEKMVQSIKDMEAEIIRVRQLKEQASKRVISLESEYRNKDTRFENMQKAYQSKIEKLYAATKQAYEQHAIIKKKNSLLEEKFVKAQEGIKMFQAYIDEYRKKIANLEDVINSLEKDIQELKGGG